MKTETIIDEKLIEYFRDIVFLCVSVPSSPKHRFECKYPAAYEKFKEAIQYAEEKPGLLDKTSHYLMGFAHGVCVMAFIILAIVKGWIL